MIVDHEDENFDKQHPFVNLEFVPLSTASSQLLAAFVKIESKSSFCVWMCVLLAKMCEVLSKFLYCKQNLYVSKIS